MILLKAFLVIFLVIIICLFVALFSLLLVPPIVALAEWWSDKFDEMLNGDDEE